MIELYLMEQEFAKAFVSARENIEAAKLEAVAGAYGAEEPSIFSIDGESAVMEINGVLRDGRRPMWMIAAGYGGCSYGEISDGARAMIEAGVKNVTIYMSTPGGMVSGIEGAYNSLKALSEVANVEVVNTGMVASAGLWLAFAANKIWADGPSVITGSIGVVMTIVDYTAYDERYGIKEVKIVSQNAPNKVPSVLTEDGMAEYQRRVDSLERVFIGVAAESRGVTEEAVKNDFGRGGVLIAQDPDEKASDAIGVGLIDGLYKNRLAAGAGYDNGVLSAEASNEESASAENEEQEVLTMALKETLAADSALKAEYDGEN